MSADLFVPMLAIVLMLVLVGRRFWSRSVRPRETGRLAVIWCAIIAGLWILVVLIRR
jgi:hypothetical protein